MLPTIAIISCSLHPASRSYVLAQEALVAVQQTGATAALYDLRTLELGFADATTAHKTPDAITIIEAIRNANAVILAMPIYNYDVNAAAKNLLEIGLRAWDRKVVSFLCVAGGRSSYMSAMGVANSLMLDFRCLIVPRFVYATGADFGDDRTATMHVAAEEIQRRVVEVALVTVELAQAVAPFYQS